MRKIKFLAQCHVIVSVFAVGNILIGVYVGGELGKFYAKLGAIPYMLVTMTSLALMGASILKKKEIQSKLPIQKKGFQLEDVDELPLTKVFGKDRQSEYARSK